MKKISIIIPAYNLEGYISKCLDSIINRDDIPDEVIIINDGSTDNTQLIINSYCKKYEYIKCIERNNSGLCASRNYGMSITKSDYLIFLDGDDLLAKNTISVCREIIKKYNPDVIIGRMELFNKKKKWTSASYDKICKLSRITNFNEDIDLIHCMSIGPKCFCLNFLKEHNIQFANGIMMTEDHWFSLLAFSKAKTIYITNHIMINYRRDRDGASTVSNKLSYYYDMFKIQEMLNKENIKNKQMYYNRFINFDLKKYGIDNITQLNIKEQFEAAKIIWKIINIIPDNYLPKQYQNIKKSYIYTMPVKKNIQKFILPVKKNIQKFIFSFVKKIYNVINRAYMRCIKHRHFMLKCIYKVLCLLPVKQNMYLFLIRPKTKMSNMQIIYDNLKIDKNKNVKKVISGQTSLSNDFYIMYNIARAKFIFIDGDYYFLFEITTRKQSHVIQLWHAAGAFKKFGCDIYKNKTEKKKQYTHHQSYSYVITSSKYVNKFYASAFNIDIEKIKALGIPRTDNLYNIDIEKEKNYIYSIYNLNKNKKIILYAPTFREPNGAFKNCGNYNMNINIDKFLDRFGEKYYLALRIHPNYKVCRYDNILDFNKINQETALAVSDILITDYSSIIFDYAFFKRPMIFYMYDLNDYIMQRSFYERLDTFLPGDIVYDETQLFNSINTMSKNYYKYENFWNKYMEECDGLSTKKLLDFINTL